ncbi:MAG: hypothetical protein PVI30_17275 [Myxococcales bacterium]|jgi:hypothetical protein
MPTPTRSYDVIELLTRRGVEFIVVGMTAGVLQGAPAVTFDLDVLYSRSPENVQRLLAALADLDAVFRTDDRDLRPKLSHLQSSGHKLLMTRLGIVDFLGALGDDASYEDLLEHAIELQVGSMVVRVLSLAKLIEVKRAAGRPKDLAALPLLESTLARSKAKG